MFIALTAAQDILTVIESVSHTRVMQIRLPGLHFKLQKGVAMTTNVAEGGCFCGAIRYRVSGSPTNKMVCHCQSCRRVAAAPVVAWVTFPRAQFELLRGEPAAFNSSEPVRRTFCPGCGTPLTYEHRDDG